MTVNGALSASWHSLVPRLSRKEPGTHCVRMRLIKTEKLRVGERAGIVNDVERMGTLGS